MLTADGPKVLEFNTRFGDPETQAVLPRLETDLLALLWAATTRRLAGFGLQVRPERSLCVVVSAAGYPGQYRTGDFLGLPAEIPAGVTLFHAGTARDSSGHLVSAGGRVLGVTAVSGSLRDAAAKAYAVCDSILWPSKYYRRDIGARQLRRV